MRWKQIAYLIIKLLNVLGIKMACPGCKGGGVAFKCDKCGAIQCKNKSCKHHNSNAASKCGSCGKSGGQKSV